MLKLNTAHGTISWNYWCATWCKLVKKKIHCICCSIALFSTFNILQNIRQ